MPTSTLSRFIQRLRAAVRGREGHGHSDGELLGRFVEHHDEAAFEALVMRHGPMVFNVCRRTLDNVQDAEDAFQAAMLVFVSKAESIGRRELVGNWLYGVAYRTALEARSMTARRRAKEKQVVELPHPVAKPEATWNELRPLLDEELNRLPDKYRAPLVLCDLEGRTWREVAGQLGIPTGTLSNRLATARRTLAERLARRGVALSAGALAVALTEQAASAALPASLVVSTVKGAIYAVTGHGSAVVYSANVLTLAEGVLRTMITTKWKSASALVVAALLAVTAAFAFLADAKKLDARLEGRWSVVLDEEYGRQKDPSGREIEITGDVIQHLQNGKPLRERFTYETDEAKKPGTIDIMIKGKTVLLGIYEIDEDKLKLCWTRFDEGDGKRPTTFATQPVKLLSDPHLRLQVLEKQK